MNIDLVSPIRLFSVSVKRLLARSFLAELCDNDRFMGTVTPSGISLIAIAKQELNMDSKLVFESAGKQAWIEANNLPGPAKMCTTLLDPKSNKTVDWLWIELGLSLIHI